MINESAIPHEVWEDMFWERFAEALGRAGVKAAEVASSLRVMLPPLAKAHAVIEAMYLDGLPWWRRLLWRAGLRW